MLVTIIDIHLKPSSTVVLFSSDFGNGAGVWEGADPIIGKSYNVEIEIGDILELGKDVKKKDECGFSIMGTSDSSIEIEGLLESLDDDGFAIIRLGKYIISFLSEGLDDLVGSFIRIKIGSISLYQYDV